MRSYVFVCLGAMMHGGLVFMAALARESSASIFLFADQLSDYYHLPVAVFMAALLVYRKKTAH